MILEILNWISANPESSGGVAIFVLIALYIIGDALTGMFKRGKG